MVVGISQQCGSMEESMLVSDPLKYFFSIFKKHKNNLGEWISPAAVTWMMRELIENDADHSDLTEKLDWYFLAIVNPDGYAYTHSNNRLWRKTR